MARWMEQNIPGDKRVLLEGKVLSNSHQSTVHPQGGSRAVALYTSLPTAFFYGMDGREFNSASYVDHVLRWDAQWMRDNPDWLPLSRRTCTKFLPSPTR
jgi:hypothetical protein